MKPVLKFNKRNVFCLTLGLLLCLGAFRTFQVLDAFSRPADFYFVLGGSANREVFCAELKNTHPEMKVVISGGSPDPCVYLMFENKGVAREGVWLEHCATNTFENFVYGIPVLKRLGARHVVMLTDYPQTVRSWPVAQILFQAQGMAVELHRLPGNSGDYKSAVEVVGLSVMACAWAVVSQLFEPHCSEVTYLPEVDMKHWRKTGYSCQQQIGVPSATPDGQK